MESLEFGNSVLCLDCMTVRRWKDHHENETSRLHSTAIATQVFSCKNVNHIFWNEWMSIKIMCSLFACQTNSIKLFDHKHTHTKQNEKQHGSWALLNPMRWFSFFLPFGMEQTYFKFLEYFLSRNHQENQYDNKIWQTQKDTEWGGGSAVHSGNWCLTSQRMEFTSRERRQIYVKN